MNFIHPCRVHEARMNERIENDVEFSEDIFKKSLKDLKLTLNFPGGENFLPPTLVKSIHIFLSIIIG